MGKPKVVVGHVDASEPELAAFYKVCWALEQAMVERRGDIRAQWRVVDRVRIWVGQKRYEQDDISYADMREYLRELPKRMLF